MLAAFDTPPIWSQSLISQIRVEPSIVVDLGAGRGELIEAASKRWQSARLIAAERNTSRLSMLRSRVPYAELLNTNLLSRSAAKALADLSEQVDVAVCNPPYFRISRNDHRVKWLKRAGFDECSWPRIMTSELVFLAQNLALLRVGGELAIILPDGIITGSDHKEVRRQLLRRHNVRRIQTLPDRSFARTEARTHLLWLEKGHGPSGAVELQCSSGTEPAISVAAEQLIERADPAFHLWSVGRRSASAMLSAIGAEVSRGRYSSSTLSKAGAARFLHTSSLSVLPKAIHAPYAVGNAESDWAIAGDILIGRVGSRCLGRLGLVANGAAPISDCLFRLRVPSNVRAEVYAALASSTGSQWLQAQARGVCARYLTVGDILRFPFAIPD